MLFLNHQAGREDKIICNFKTITLNSVLINGGKDKGMKLKKMVGKKIATLALAATMAVGGSLSVFAATGFTLSEPSLVHLSGYLVTGSMSYYAPTNTSTSYYLLVNVSGIYRGSSGLVTELKSGYGYAKASATTDSMTTKPFYIENEGKYNTGVGGFINYDVKSVYNP